jgi:lysozyme family protein
VAQLVEALRYKLEGRGFDSRRCHWNASMTYSFRPHYGPGVDSVSNRNKYQKYFLGVKAAGV